MFSTADTNIKTSNIKDFKDFSILLESLLDRYSDDKNSNSEKPINQNTHNVSIQEIVNTSKVDQMNSNMQKEINVKDLNVNDANLKVNSNVDEINFNTNVSLKINTNTQENITNLNNETHTQYNAANLNANIQENELNIQNDKIQENYEISPGQIYTNETFIDNVQEIINNNVEKSTNETILNVNIEERINDNIDEVSTNETNLNDNIEEYINEINVNGNINEVSTNETNLNVNIEERINEMNAYGNINEESANKMNLEETINEINVTTIRNDLNADDEIPIELDVNMTEINVTTIRNDLNADDEIPIEQDVDTTSSTTMEVEDIEVNDKMQNVNAKSNKLESLVNSIFDHSEDEKTKNNENYTYNLLTNDPLLSPFSDSYYHKTSTMADDESHLDSDIDLFIKSKSYTQNDIELCKTLTIENQIKKTTNYKNNLLVINLFAISICHDDFDDYFNNSQIYCILCKTSVKFSKINIQKHVNSHTHLFEYLNIPYNNYIKGSFARLSINFKRMIKERDIYIKNNNSILNVYNKLRDMKEDQSASGCCTEQTCVALFAFLFRV
ncbi:uncharacterized protein LOC142318925 [Lycorma delicatula]|uniref:uncharacterized protein LOC142318925 n=1 Tax=Lycorma delicatula TaxID=130591 RepID=UPI003F518933